MNEYQEQALNFLKECSATLDIKFSHVGKNELWKDDNALREIYIFTINTPNGSYSSCFYDSIYNYKRKQWIDKRLANTTRYGITGREAQRLREERKTLIPNEYSILSCLDGHPVGSFKDWCWEFGYDDDSITALKLYAECQEEYDGLRKIFTNEQLEKLNEIV